MKAASRPKGTGILDADLRMLCDSLPAIVWTSLPDGASQYLNDLGTEFTGLFPASDEAWDWFSFTFPADEKRVRREWRRALKRASAFSSQYRLRRADGEFRWHQVNALPMNDEFGHLRNWIGTAVDIEDSVNSETALALSTRHADETTALLEMILNDAPVGLAYVDRDFRVRRVNKELATFTDSTVAERSGQLVSDALPTVWTQVEPAFQRILDGGPPILNNKVTGPSSKDPSRSHHWMASYYPVRIADEVIGIGVVVVDVTTELDMENQRLLLATIVEGSGDAIFGSNADGIITSWNAAAEALFDIKASAIIGKTLATFMPPQQFAEAQEVRLRVTATGVAEHIDSMRFTKNDAPYEIQMTVSPIFDADGHVIGISRIAHDITEQRRDELMLRESQRQLIETQRIAHLGGVQYDVLSDTMTWSDEMYRILGLDTKLIPSTELFISSTHPDDTASVRKAWYNATLHGVPFDIDFRIIRSNGEQRFTNARAEIQYDEKGKPIKMVGTLSDETERVAQDAERRDLELRFETGFEQSAIGTAIVDLQGIPLRVNQAVCDLLGRPKELLVGHKWTKFTHPDEIPLWTILNEKVIEGASSYADERRYLRPDGSTVWAAAHVSIVRDSHGTPLYLFTNLLDITQYRNLSDELAHLAMHDTLTGLPNRALLADRLSQSLARSGRSRTPVSVMFLDIDDFKEINDSLGHSSGDELLVHVASQIRRTIRPGDTVARFGGDEFVVVCESASDAAVSAIAARVLEALNEPVQLSMGEVRVSASIGISNSVAASTPETLLQTADFAMYRAKGMGSGSIALYDEKFHDKVELRLATTAALGLALERGEFTVYYQPVIDIGTGRLISAEALLRWEHPTGILVNPDDFVPLAEHSGLIVPIGEWVLSQACEQLVQWKKTLPSMTIAVNFSVRQILNPEIISMVDGALRHWKFSPSDLSLELTESILMEDIDYCAKTLTSLKTLGVQLVIDDFGTGYSSLSYLKLFPFDAVKIDRAFVDGLGSDEHDSALVAAIIAMSFALKLEVTAEGVETKDQLALLKDLGCQRAQGFLLSKPMPAAELTRLIDDGHRWPVA